ncbi:hypothetical protein E2C01_083554 [Portunus trituberculatus]|uniref:Uncharacterized protein n=1 Tax=Portunus trituberculatus TaxID=210409 RepID=A0A5B7J6W1_PORTR|nr:hypothetical protein [Portunus trituberculatus]
MVGEGGRLVGGRRAKEWRAESSNPLFKKLRSSSYPDEEVKEEEEENEKEKEKKKGEKGESASKARQE